jgi:hypothetical protein
MKKLILVCFALIALLPACDNPKPVPVPEPSVVQYATGLVRPDHAEYGVLHFTPKHHAGPMPENFDWVAQGKDTPVRNQGNCGSCWAFGGTQTLEGAAKVFLGQDVDLSEQQLVGNLYSGCGGGYFTYEFQLQYGQTEEKNCPYSATNKRCSKTLPPAVKPIAGGMCGQPNRRPTVEELELAIMTYGYISVTVAANGAFMSYSGGLGDCGGGQTNHIVTLVGWKTANGKVYFHLKNSWGTKWGEKGYGWFRAGCYNLAEEASWIAVQSTPCTPPALKLPKYYPVAWGDEIVLAAKKIDGVTYEWLEDGKVIGTESEVSYQARETKAITLKVHNACGDGEIKTEIRVE